jgi:hypothetical protein
MALYSPPRERWRTFADLAHVLAGPSPEVTLLVTTAGKCRRTFESRFLGASSEAPGRAFALLEAHP